MVGIIKAGEILDYKQDEGGGRFLCFGDKVGKASVISLSISVFCLTSRPDLDWLPRIALLRLPVDRRSVLPIGGWSLPRQTGKHGGVFRQCRLVRRPRSRGK